MSVTRQHPFPRRLLKMLPLFCLLLLSSCSTSKVEPVALAPEDVCSDCKMAISEKQYAAQFIDSEGQAFKFDDIGCMANFVKNKKNTSKALAYFVMDFDTRQWTKADTAYYVHSNELTTPMGGSTIAFRDQSRAQEAAAKYHGKSLLFHEIIGQ